MDSFYDAPRRPPPQISREKVICFILHFVCNCRLKNRAIIGLNNVEYSVIGSPDIIMKTKYEI